MHPPPRFQRGAFNHTQPLFYALARPAEGEGFEPPAVLPASIFKIDAIDHSANLLCHFLNVFLCLKMSWCFFSTCSW